MVPVVTIVGLQFGRLLSGSVIIENVFARQGIGAWPSSDPQSDVPVVHGVVLVAGVPMS